MANKYSPREFYTLNKREGGGSKNIKPPFINRSILKMHSIRKYEDSSLRLSKN